jgi:putative oxidoreductase
MLHDRSHVSRFQSFKVSKIDPGFSETLKLSNLGTFNNFESSTRQENHGMKAPFLIGRILFGGFFLYSGINHLMHRKDMASYAASKGVPKPEVAVSGTAIPLIIGGTSMLLGLKPKWGAMAILGFLAGISPIMHNFWRNEDPNERMKNMTDFMKNLALAGGALALLGVEEPWEASVAKPRLSDKIRKATRQLAA